MFLLCHSEVKASMCVPFCSDKNVGKTSNLWGLIFVRKKRGKAVEGANSASDVKIKYANICISQREPLVP